jgi:hypothetical protein
LYSFNFTLLLVWSHYNKKVYGRDHELVDRYEISISQTTMDIFPISVDFFSFTYPWQDFYRIWRLSNTAGFLTETVTAYPLQAHVFTHDLFVVSMLLNLFSFLCCVLLLLLFCLSSFCVVCPQMLPASIWIVSLCSHVYFSSVNMINIAALHEKFHQPLENN